MTSSVSRICRGTIVSALPTTTRTRRGLLILVTILVVLLGLWTDVWYDSTTLRSVLTTTATTTTPRHPPSTTTTTTKTSTTTPTSDKTPTKPVVYYSIARNDRSGMVIHNMLEAHAYAFDHDRAAYGGACQIERHVNFTSDSHREWYIRTKRQERKDTKTLIHAMGLEDVLHFACPTNRTSVQEIMLAPKIRYRRETNRHHLFTEEWLQHMFSVVHYPTTTSDDTQKKKKTVAVHVRRGDANPCTASQVDFVPRYSPNAFYLAVLDRYLPEEGDYDISVYSESQTLEPFDVFRERNYTLHLDTDLVSVWRAFLSADVLFMSRSSFAYVPALLRRSGRVIYYRGPSKLKSWTMVDQDLMDFHDAEIERLYAEYCTKNHSAGTDNVIR